MDGGEQMKIVCFALLCILLSGCGNAKTAAEEPKMRFENLDPARVNVQYGGQKMHTRMIFCLRSIYMMRHS